MRIYIMLFYTYIPAKPENWITSYLPFALEILRTP